MDESVTTAVLDEWVRTFAALVAENRDHLTELDAAIGDADHGSNMDRGMKAAVAALDESPPATAGALFTKVGMTLVSTVGGASGPLFGTFFLRMGGSLGDAETVSATDLAAALRAGLGGVVDRGKAEPGDKTMYDALAPGRRRAGRGARPMTSRCPPHSKPPGTPPRRAATRPPRCWRARAGPAISASAASATRTRAPRRWPCSSRRPRGVVVGPSSGRHDIENDE